MDTLTNETVTTIIIGLQSGIAMDLFENHITPSRLYFDKKDESNGTVELRFRSTKCKNLPCYSNQDNCCHTTDQQLEEFLETIRIFSARLSNRELFRNFWSLHDLKKEHSNKETSF
jgi:hypothetical protein